MTRRQTERRFRWQRRRWSGRPSSPYRGGPEGNGTKVEKRFILGVTRARSSEFEAGERFVARKLGRSSRAIRYTTAGLRRGAPPLPASRLP